MTNPFAQAVSPPKVNFDADGEKALFDQQEREAYLGHKLKVTEAKLKRIKAEIKEKRAVTKLKSSYAGSVMFFLWIWFGALCLLMLAYVTTQLTLNREIPKEIIIAAFTSTAFVAGLVGFVIKGLFNGQSVK